jgi:hypothetical protein
MRVPDSIEPVLGWRIWRIDTELGLLRSPFLGRDLWLPEQPFRAGCGIPIKVLPEHVPPHDSPDSRCTCGIYAAVAVSTLVDDLKTLSTIIAHEARIGYRRDLIAVGLVSLWGRVIICERGYRAELAYPKEIYAPPSFHSALAGYGVPVMPVPYPIVETLNLPAWTR